MKKKMLSIRRASFYAMLRGGLLLLLINFLLMSILSVVFTYYYVKDYESKLASLIMTEYRQRQVKLKNVADDLAGVLDDNLDEKDNEKILKQVMHKDTDIRGIVILNSNGIVQYATDEYEKYIGMNFAQESFYSKAVKDKNISFSASYIEAGNSENTLKLASNVINSGGNAIGMIILIINPELIPSGTPNNINFSLINYNGDIISRSNFNNISLKSDSLSALEKQSKKDGKVMLYKDSSKNKYVLGYIKSDKEDSMYVAVQYYVFDNIKLIASFLVIFGTSSVLEMFVIFMFASKASRTMTEYAESFTKFINKASRGEQKVDDSKKFYYKEISSVIDDFIAMTDKIKQREEELENSNHELTIANKEIKNMVKSLGEKEKQMKNQYIQIIWTLLNLLEIKDQYTAGHSRSVTIYAVQIAKKLNSCYGYGLDVEKIRVASTLHDIGKISIDNNILNKPSRLTNEEFEIIKTHTTYGYYALRDIDNLKEERNMVKYHHEKYDGTGYPDGKKGDEIPLGARIICVADSFDAMTSNRPYRSGMPMEKAIDELKNNIGKQFDPFIVNVFIDILNEQNSNEPVLA